MKTLILVVIFSVLPVFFLFVFTMSSFNLLNSSQRRVRRTLEMLAAALRRRQAAAARLAEAAGALPDAPGAEVEAVRRAREAAVAAIEKTERHHGDDGALDQAFEAETKLVTATEELVRALPPASAEGAAEPRREWDEANQRVACTRLDHFQAVASYNRHRQRGWSRLIAGVFLFPPARPLLGEPSSSTSVRPAAAS
ncbi:MAG TPA: hypothetical protein VNO52_12205 [Methylomirabilota bacterium]|nr:hypothetical protein [Methylomirabilota bacterium]